MLFILGFIIGLYVGVLAMGIKFKKQLKQMKDIKQAAPVSAETGSFSAENLVNSAKSEEE